MHWFDWLFRRKSLDRQLDAELAFHIENRARDLARSGVPATEAGRRARLEFGGYESVKEDCRDVRRWQPAEELFKDLRYALRVFRKTPAFSLAAIGTLALGIGACTSIFTVVDGVLLRPLPYPEPDRLVKPLTKNPPLRIKNGPASYPDYLDWRDSGVFESVGIYLTDNAVLSTGGQSERVVITMATSGVLSALRVRPLAGRIFTAAESQPSLTPVVMLTERTWRRRFGADPKLLGGAIELNGLSLTVVGILPASFTVEGDPEVWTSLISTGDETPRDNRYWSALARLRIGVTLRQTGVQLDQISRWVAGEGNSRAGFLQGISQSVTPDYFAALGVPLRLGRTFSARDGDHAPLVAIVNDEFARQKFAHRNPIGKRIGVEDGKETLEIVGVVGSMKSGGLQESSPPQIYVPMAQKPVPVLAAFLRTAGDPATLGRTAQQAILSVDPDVPAYRLRTGDQLLGRSLARRRLLMTLISSFAAIALVLASLGLYGVLAYGVAQRTREIGIRMALGAAAGQVLAGVVRQGMIVAAVGALAGLAGALALTPVLKDALYNVSPLDAGVLLLAPPALLLVALLACAIPARRAARIDPVLALRHE